MRYKKYFTGQTSELTPVILAERRERITLTGSAQFHATGRAGQVMQPSDLANVLLNCESDESPIKKIQAPNK